MKKHKKAILTGMALLTLGTATGSIWANYSLIIKEGRRSETVKTNHKGIAML